MSSKKIGFWTALCGYELKEKEPATIDICGYSVNIQKYVNDFSGKKETTFGYYHPRMKEIRLGAMIKGLKVLWRESNNSLERFAFLKAAAQRGENSYGRAYTDETLTEIGDKGSYTLTVPEAGYGDDIYASALFPLN